MSAPRLVDHGEFPARELLKAAQARLAASLVVAEAAAAALARGHEHLGVLEGARDEARAEIVDEARNLAETFEQEGVCAIIGGSSQRQREIEDEFSAFAITLDILQKKNTDAQRSIIDADAAVEAGIKAVIEETVSPLLCRMRDNEGAAAMLRSELRSLVFCGKFGLAPVSLPSQLSREPANVFHADRPLNFEQQKFFDRRKAAWCDFAAQLKEDADAQRNLGD